ncbi:LOG family protein [Burkholderia ubonensis]|uniref:LOG family protein n=1 Tax=Burkholderia ubonensis TaxID=101571 RepID=UPI000751AA63|nr:LOG family protein [Burkholderia ubonensis]KVO15083.1 hypothetical protein WJ73_12415 [Burkholderia ubonensis]
MTAALKGTRADVATKAAPGKRRHTRRRTTRGRRASLPRSRRGLNLAASAGVDADTACLTRPAMRGIRLQLDYWKAEERLQRERIGHAVVIYGSTRIVAPAVANARLVDANQALAERPHDARRRRAVADASRLVEHSAYYRVAREFGRLVGLANRRARIARLAVVTGGGPGIMEAANRGAFESGAPSISFNIELPREQAPNRYLTPDLCFRFHYFAIRKLHLLERAKAAVFFPGGYGTFDELFEVLTLLQTGKIPPLPVILVGEAYWRRTVDFAFLADDGMIDRRDLDLFAYCESAPDIWRAIGGWYARQRTRPGARRGAARRARRV